MDNFGFYKDGNVKKQRGFLSYFIVGVAGAVIGGMLVLMFAPAALLGKAVAGEDTESTKVVSERVIIPQNNEVSLTTAIAKKVTPAVVGIRTTKYNDNMFFGKTKVEGVGSGVIVDNKGYILTNNHVADSQADDITVFLIDGSSAKGRTVWTDPLLDLSIIKIDKESLTVAEIGNSDELEVGELAVAIGNPLGLRFERSVTAGIISALNRTIPMDDDRFMEDLIQTDASINQGNSGGPLINSKGRIIGINTIKVSSAEGMGFAIPINIAVPVIKSIVETGEFVTPYIGITGLDKEIANFYDYKISSGIYVANIDRNGPAYKAGVRRGDILTEINDIPVNTLTSLKQSIFSAGSGSSIKVTYQDKSGSSNTVTVVLGSMDGR